MTAGRSTTRATRSRRSLVEALSLMERARPIVGEDGPYDRARQRQRERRELAAIPAWFSAEDLIAAPWEVTRAHLA